MRSKFLLCTLLCAAALPALAQAPAASDVAARLTAQNALYDEQW